MLKIYSAGSMSYFYNTGQREKAEKWRRQLKGYFTDAYENVFVFDPTENFNNNLKYSGKSIVMQNKFFLDYCNMIVMNTEELLQSPGTLFEGFDYYSKMKPIIVFGEGEILQPHINEFITQKFLYLDEVITNIEHMYGQILKEKR